LGLNSFQLHLTIGVNKICNVDLLYMCGTRDIAHGLRSMMSWTKIALSL